MVWIVDQAAHPLHQQNLPSSNAALAFDVGIVLKLLYYGSLSYVSDLNEGPLNSLPHVGNCTVGQLPCIFLSRVLGQSEVAECTLDPSRFLSAGGSRQTA